MLTNEDNITIESFIDKLILSLKNDTEKAKSNGVTGKQLIEKVTNMTVNRLTPESKMILSSVYNMMSVHTLAEDYFSDISHKADFYSADILSELNGKFEFDIPKEIDYKKSYTEINMLISSGAIIVAGSIVSVTLKNWIPIGIAAIIAGIMALVIKKCSSSSPKSDIDTVINRYFASVKASLLAWIKNIEAYYDELVAELKGKG